MKRWQSVDDRRVITLNGKRYSVHLLLDGERGEGGRRGVAGTGEFAGLEDPYPACSLHGAMNRLGKDKSIWRCLVVGCNCGLELMA